MVRAERPHPLTLARALAALGIALAGCGKHDVTAERLPADPIAVRVARLHLGRLTSPVEVSGSLVAVHSVTVGAAAAGRILTTGVREGDRVRAGDRIAQIDPAPYAAGVAQTQAAAAASAAGARAQVDAANAKERLAAQTAARMASLFAQGAISKQQDDESAAALAAARASLAQAAAGLRAARSDLRAARSRSVAAAAATTEAQAGVSAAAVPLRDATVTAPFDGVVTKTFVEPGAFVAAGSPVVNVQDDRHLEAEATVPNDVASALAPGETVDLRIDAAGGTPRRARVRAIFPTHDPALRSALVRIDVPPSPGLIAGMYVRVRFASRTGPVWVAPLAALVTRAGQSGVFVIRDGKASFVPLQTGTVGATGVELAGYDGPASQVAVSGIERIGDGSPVTVER
jgi:multidrug efflux pump subunit AcrA (membrane-fusion protein)